MILLPIERRATIALARSLIAMTALEQWTVQGFGQARLKISKTERLQVWHSNLKVPEVSEIHDHPWDFESLCIHGVLCNVRYYQVPLLDSTSPTHIGQRLIPGEGGGLIDKRFTVRLKEREGEVYGGGGSYEQSANEIHKTYATDYTVTLIHRIPVEEEKDRARVFWPLGKEWVSAAPRPLTREEYDWLIPETLERLSLGDIE